MISITLLSIKDDLKKIQEAYSLKPDFIHVDVMDGQFVNNTVDFLDLPAEIKKDVHLMVYDIKKYVDIYQKYQPEYITFHIEATNQVEEMIQYIKSLNIKVGIAINPQTPVRELLPYLDSIDLVLVMGVQAGAGGQSFLESTTDKIHELKQIRENKQYHYVIEVDGGINSETKKKCQEADILAVGSYITVSDNYLERYQNMIH